MRKLEDHMEILMSLWVQLVKSKTECLRDIAWIKKSKVDHHPAILTGQRRLKVQNDLIQHALKHSGNTVLILDGLDEVPRKLQRKVVEHLRILQKENDSCRILISSRPYDSIARIFTHDPQVYIEAPDVDLTLYMEERFSRQDWDCHCEFKSRDIIEILLKNCQKSFILTKLIMDEVEVADSKAHCERIISDLPSTVDEAYRRGLNRLKAESSSDGLVDGLPCMSIQAVFWVAFAKSQMTGNQLEHALAIADSNPDSDSKVRMWRERGIDSQTGKLVVVDPKNGELVIVHETLTKYLTKDETRLDFFPKIRECMHQVQLECLLADHCKSKVLAGSKKEYFEQYPLLPYAVSNWGEGLGNVLERDTSLWYSTEVLLGTFFHEWNEVIRDEIIQLFDSKLRWRINPRKLYNHHILDVGSIDGLYWIVVFDLQKLVPFWIDAHTECLVKDPIPTTPLALAAFLNNIPMMRLLIEHGAQVNITQRTNTTIRPPLCEAIIGGHVSTIEFLLQNGADMTSRSDAYDISPLDHAYLPPTKTLALLMASYISRLNRTSAQELQFLIKSGCVKELHSAIQRGMDVNHPCENGKRAFDYALKMGHQEITEVLINSGATSNLCWPAEKSEFCTYPTNLRELTVTPLVSVEKEYDQVVTPLDTGTPNNLMLEVHVQTQRPIQSIVFETITKCPSAWRDSCYGDNINLYNKTITSHEGIPIHDSYHGTYIGSHRSKLNVALSNQDGPEQTCILQGNVIACDAFRLHTNIWNLSELETSSPAKAKMMREIRESSILQITAIAWGGRENHIKYIRVRMYGEEIHPST